MQVNLRYAAIPAEDVGVRPVQPCMVLSVVRLARTADDGRAIPTEWWTVFAVPRSAAPREQADKVETDERREE